MNECGIRKTQKQGKLIVLEGIDGCGKSTQAGLLADRLIAEGRRVVLTAEPTDLPSGKALREALSGREKKSEWEMAAMFVLDRIAHNEDPQKGLNALLTTGCDVICDRYYYSTLAYQGQSTDYAWVKSMNLQCPAIRRPDLCIYLDLLPEQSLARISKGRSGVEIYENTETLTAVRNRFFMVLDDLRTCDSIAVVDASRSPEEIATEIFALVSPLLTR